MAWHGVERLCKRRCPHIGQPQHHRKLCILQSMELGLSWRRRLLALATMTGQTDGTGVRLVLDRVNRGAWQGTEYGGPKAHTQRLVFGASPSH